MDSLSDYEYKDTMLTPSLAEDMTSICQEGGYSSFRAFVAAAEVLQCEIQSVYLPVNGNADKVCGMLSKSITPSVTPESTSAADLTRVRIMWSRTQHPHSGLWVPNHFVPLVEPRSLSATVTSADDNDDCNNDLQSSFASTSVPHQQSVSVIDASYATSRASDVSEVGNIDTSLRGELKSSSFLDNTDIFLVADACISSHLLFYCIHVTCVW